MTTPEEGPIWTVIRKGKPVKISLQPFPEKDSGKPRIYGKDELDWFKMYEPDINQAETHQ